MATENNSKLNKDFLDTLFVIGYLTDHPALRSAFQVKNIAAQFYHHNAEACKALVQKFYPAECAVIESYHSIDGGKHPLSLTLNEFCVEMIVQNLTAYYNELNKK